MSVEVCEHCGERHDQPGRWMCRGGHSFDAPPCSVAAENNTVVTVEGSLLAITARTSGDSILAVLSDKQKREIAEALMRHEAKPQNNQAET